MVHQQCVDDATDLDQLLPVTTVACEARHLASGNHADQAQRHLGHQSAKAASIDRASGRLAEIFVDHLDVVPAKGLKTLAHRVLQPATLLVVCQLLGR